MVSFDPAATFLLDMQWPNLFEPASALPTNTRFRCKGCRMILPQQEREKHFRKHVRERDKAEAKRAAEIYAKRVKSLEKARAMKQAA